MADVTISVRPNGPLIVTGACDVKDAEGNVLPARERTVLCRCGASATKPYCDGEHKNIGFTAA